jgi:hypothetical protein
MSQPHPHDPTIIISLGNCGTSERTFFGTLDNCIVIQYDSNNKKVSLKFLKNNKVEVRFFKSINSKKYTSNRLLNSFPNICDNKNISLLCIVNYLTSKYELTSTGEVISLNSPPDTTTPKYTSLLRWTNKLITDMDIFFTDNPKLQHWREILRPYTDRYIEIYNSLQKRQIHNTKSLSIHSLVTSLSPTKVADINSLSLLSSSSSSKTGPHKDTIQPELSSVADTPRHQPKVTAQPELSSVADTPPRQPKETKYHKTETPSGITYYKLDPSGEVDYSTGYRETKATSGIKYYKLDPEGNVDYMLRYDNLPTEGGSNKRYRTTRRSRKYQSRRKSRRHIRKRVRTHRHKSRKSRK